MKEKLMELLKSKLKEGHKLSDVQKEAKMNVIGDLKSAADEAMSDGLKKVTVASNSKEGLKKGLEKAEDLMDAKMPEMESEEMESPEHEMDEECEDMSLEDIQSQIDKLMEMKKQKEEMSS